MMSNNTYHTIVIGAGSGGLTVAVGMANLGKRSAIIEAKDVGGDCTNVGCVPSKTLIHQAEILGASGGPATALDEVRRKRNALRDKETEEFGHVPNLDLIFGRGKLLDAHRVQVSASDGSEQILTAEHIVIATGARARPLNIPGLPAERQLSNESVFEIAQTPQHLAIIGGGVIGMEMAFAFRKLGSRVSMITNADRVMERFIPEVAAALEPSLKAHGIALYTGATAHSYAVDEQVLRIERNAYIESLDGVDYVLVAVGRQKNLENVGLEAAGVKFDMRRGIDIDSYGRSNVPHIYAIGDVTPTSAFTHSANAQGRRVVQRIAFPLLPARSPEPFYPSATFSDPEVATAGMSQEQIAARYHPKLIKRIRIDLPTQTDRGYTDGLSHGFIIVDAIRLSGKILSVTAVGPRVSELISLFTLAIKEGLSLYKLYGVVYPYPTYSSGIGKVADTFLRETLPNVRSELAAYLRYRWAKPQTPSRAGKLTA
ncbi:MAG: NAD(P)/FAD-dependent oxidoreductase [Oscillochloris sp.]|nr:NAD(P)/FAD-dependent oxidoreductase [Oscillochloris sp.]